MQPIIRASRGQASLALLATVPAILFAAAALAQIALIGYSAWSVSHAARAAARAAHVGAAPEQAARAALPPLLRAELRAERRGETWSVRLPAPRILPLGPAIEVGAEARLGALAGR